MRVVFRLFAGVFLAISLLSLLVGVLFGCSTVMVIGLAGEEAAVFEGARYTAAFLGVWVILFGAASALWYLPTYFTEGR